MADYLHRLTKFKEDLEFNRIQDNATFQTEFQYITQNWESLDIPYRNQALEIFNELINLKINPMLRAIFAVAAGSIIEEGGVNSTIILRNVLTLFMNSMFNAKKILEVYQKEEHSQEKISDSDLERQYPDAFFAWKILDTIWVAMKAILIMSKDARLLLKNHPKYGEIHDTLRAYMPFHGGTRWVYMAANIFDGELLVFHPETKRGYKVAAESIEHPFTLSSLLTQTLAGDPEKGLIPKKENTAATQFWMFNWKVIHDLEKYDLKAHELMLKSPAYIGSGSMMDEILWFKDEFPIVFLIDLGIVSWSFDTNPSFSQIHPKIELKEILDEKTVEEWFSKLKMS